MIVAILGNTVSVYLAHKKEVRDWKITGKGADYFRITDYGLLQMDWEPAYVEPCVTATVTAVLEELEARLRDSDTFRRQMKSLHEASKAFSKDSGMSKKCWKLYDTLENEWSKYNIMYGEESCRLGFEDSMQITSEKEIRAKGSVLSFMDMTHLVYLYDAVKKLNVFLLGEDDAYECLTDILDNAGMVPEKRAKMLTGQDKA